MNNFPELIEHGAARQFRLLTSPVLDGFGADIVEIYFLNCVGNNILAVDRQPMDGCHCLDEGGF